jgi:hypothetical protein
MIRAREEKMLDRATLAECVHAGTLAPSIFNSQPWRFRIRGGEIDVLADPVRSLPAVDPDGREMHISLGSAVLNIEVMLTAHGIRPRVMLLPSPPQRHLVARVSGAGEVTPSLRDVAMVSAIRRRGTARVPYEERRLSPALIESLVEAARVEGATLTVLDDAEARSVLALVRTADNRLRDDPAYRVELARWTADWPGRRDGVAPAAFGPPSLDAALPLRDFGAYQPSVSREPQRFETSPTIAVLSTTADGREDWLRAGMALERVLLEATIAGVSSSFFTQPMEVAHLRRLYDEGHPASSSQMIFRLGYARQPAAVPSPRRPVAEVLIDG